ncbi:hypothetical protein ISN75_07055 [Dyella marensis]|uniref:hypothetical protein n=1 Tax=Dyella marensis TaxID=500610 RepID=UPI0031D51E56
MTSHGVGWGERSEPQHGDRGTGLLGFAALTPTCAGRLVSSLEFPDKPVAQWSASGRGAGCSAEALLGDAGHVERIRAALSRPFAILAA